MGKKFEIKNAWLEMAGAEKEEINQFNKDYAGFITVNKTEREFVKAAVELLEKEGFKNLEEVQKLREGDRVYKVNRDRAIAAAVIGQRPLTDGLRIVGAHLDSPRIDLKPNPVYEDSELVFFNTHYYGGIKKYQWVSIPLALHGVVVKEDGTRVDVVIGENESDPIFYISDLLPHLSKDQMKKKMTEGITGEQLDVLIGSVPAGEEEDSDKVKVKSAVLDLLNEKYGITEEDLVSADLKLVPAYRARDLGFDRGLLAGYGHDDRVCSYTALRGLIDLETPEYTGVALLVDKEEIGSMGATGMQSRFFENCLAEMIDLTGEDYSDLALRKALENSWALSADVNAAFDPNFSDVFDKDNSSYLGKGVVLTKYTGARGKYSSSEATAEFVGRVRALFNNGGVPWQIGELGKVDQGGGGTIAQFLANYNMDVVDCGPAVLSMHSPFEVVSKVDVYSSYLAYSVFFGSQG
ncbi:aminopeptidase [Halothermothrix orenii]|uniref:M18 family aminopeptidase n=1 Tax=Halothermothrix orenii (strain H 168 / OCM 544 / DSM 9562) TaxID=373903 RepID=B8CZ44_HALOH|nr:aminopeptidase [Halothermothrix orenii]ACL70563.1 peptidase M18 aminopeptidase I [Halothermothrix orenii H 168]